MHCIIQHCTVIVPCHQCLYKAIESPRPITHIPGSHRGVADMMQTLCSQWQHARLKLKAVVITLNC